MKMKSNGRRNFFRLFQTARFKSGQVIAMSFLATLKLAAQDQSAMPPPSGTTGNSTGAGTSTGTAASTSTDVSAPTATAPVGTPQPVIQTPGDDTGTMPPPILKAPKTTKNEISASADVMLGQGTITLPLGYSLKKSLAGVPSIPVGAFSVPRSSTYYGGTISYSYGQAWYVDVSYARGESSGNQTIDTGSLGPLNSNFSLDDTWYQVYVKYTFPQLRGKRFSAYLRAGASYVSADLSDLAQNPESLRYTQKDSTTDYLGNFGFGLGYTLYSNRRLRLGVQFEGEGFYGERTQDSLETLSLDRGLSFVSASINNTLYGGIGRATVHAEYRLGRSGLFKIFGEFGLEGRYTLIDYPSGGGSSNELLWGPYAKLGIRYAF